MIYSDFHLHSDFSSDGKATMEVMIEAAMKKGLKQICFTDHMDYDYPAVSDYNFMFDIDPYMQKLAKMREQYINRIEILSGIELGLQPHLKERLHSLTDNYSFDFIIGSSHVVDGFDPYFRDYWTDKTEAEGIYRYFESIIENINAFDGFHVYGHIDYIVRYTPSKAISYKEYSYQQYSDILDEVLKTILSKGRGIEVNTAGYKYGLEHTHPKTEILKRYLELGGELITIGSDAHRPEHIGNDFDRAVTLLKSLGYRYYATFKNGKPVFELL